MKLAACNSVTRTDKALYVQYVPLEKPRMNRVLAISPISPDEGIKLSSIVYIEVIAID